MVTLYCCIGILFIIAGFPLAWRMVPPNPLYGFRLPRTLRDPAAWYRANAAFGKDLCLAGPAIIGVALVSRYELHLSLNRFCWVNLAAVVVALAVSIIHGWRAMNKAE